MIHVVVIGAGGFGREVLDTIDALDEFVMDGFIVDSQFGFPGALVNDRPIIGGFDWLSSHVKDVKVVCAIGSPQLRASLTKRAKRLGCSFASLIHPSVIRTKWCSIGEGVVITAGSIIGNQVQISNHVHINAGCIIGHDAVLEDYATTAPGVHVSGNVTLREGCYVGTGANIIQGLDLGAWSIVGAGSAVTNDIPTNTTAVGVPAKVIKTRPEGWHL
jgi:sugar O-acyltransferase (sialic acid O-acetyltransferase NeuD family)